METILEFIQRYPSLTAIPAIVGLFAAIGALLLSQRWQIHIIALMLLYFFVGLLHTRIIRPEVALIKALIGWLICLTLYVTGRFIDRSQEERKREEEEKEATAERGPKPRWLPPLPAGTPLRSLVLLAILILAYVGAVHLPLPRVPGAVGLACYLLAIGGLLLAGMSEEPLDVGIGLLVFLAGFDLFYGALEPSLVVAGLLGAGNFLLTLAATFLAVSKATAEEGEP